jgi:small subunit ribosomal protein S20
LANIKSAIKRIRSSARKQQNNRILRGRARSAIKKARLALGEGKPEDAQTAVKQAISELDRAAGKGVVHKNNAARRKARLMKQLNKSQQQK